MLGLSGSSGVIRGKECGGGEYNTAIRVTGSREKIKECILTSSDETKIDILVEMLKGNVYLL